MWIICSKKTNSFWLRPMTLMMKASQTISKPRSTSAQLNSKCTRWWQLSTRPTQQRSKTRQGNTMVLSRSQERRNRGIMDLKQQWSRYKEALHKRVDQCFSFFGSSWAQGNTNQFTNRRSNLKSEASKIGMRSLLICTPFVPMTSNRKWKSITSSLLLTETTSCSVQLSPQSRNLSMDSAKWFSKLRTSMLPNLNLLKAPTSWSMCSVDVRSIWISLLTSLYRMETQGRQTRCIAKTWTKMNMFKQSRPWERSFNTMTQTKKFPPMGSEPRFHHKPQLLIAWLWMVISLPQSVMVLMES